MTRSWLGSLLAVTCLGLASATGAAKDLPEVRQFVTFKFSPGETGEAIRLFRERALPLYEKADAMLRFRGYREAESPVPLDLMVVSSFRGMEGMDRSNDALRELAARNGTSIGELYGAIGALSEHHTDEFVEMDASLSRGDAGAGRLQVFVSIQLTPAGASTYMDLLREEVLDWEDTLGGLTGSDSGSFLLSDGFDAFRVFGVESLGAWHDYLRSRRAQDWSSKLASLTVKTRVMVLVGLPELSVR